MLTRKISTKMKWFFMVALMLTLLISFISCSDDLVGPQFESNNDDDDGESNKGDGNGNGNISLNQIFEGTSGREIFVLYV